MNKLNWNQMSELGLIIRINQEILHPLGLALYRTPDDGNSPGVLIADDGFWEYSENKSHKIFSDDEVRAKYLEFIDNSIDT